ncbi:hypothetical protein GCM10010191_12610 [Actinomadura vinacea]|uniref:Tyr recombinase domain-containing protein n=1 Tax=Actinomadura vinacea TaxID=115336 RepID=A0ABN3IJH3_9ACTN
MPRTPAPRNPTGVPDAGRVPASCRACLAWGVMAYRGVCRPCYEFAARHQGTDTCAACGRDLPVHKAYCRMCWCQARLDRPPAQVPRHRLLLPYVRQVRHHQLFLAGLPAPRDLVQTRPRRLGVGRGVLGPPPPKPPPPAAVRPRTRWLQPALPDQMLDQVPRRYRYGRFDLRKPQTTPDNPWLAWALHLAYGMAQTHGWSGTVHRAVNRSLVMLLADHHDGEVVRTSHLREVMRRHRHPLRRTTQVLEAMGILIDDRPAAFQVWLNAKLADLAPAIAAHTRTWALTLRDGGPRVRARGDQHARGYLHAALPALRDWSARYHHLREITRDDVLAHLDTLHGHRRMMAAVTLRSLLAWAKKNNLIFRDPAARIRVGKAPQPIFQPLTDEQIAQTVQAATTPHARLYVALAAVHAARNTPIRALRLDDVDLGNRRITIAGRTRPIDDLTHRLLLDWLDHRRTRWPNTANPHLLVSVISSNGLDPVSHIWLERSLKGLPASLEKLRIDRQLEEALTHGADPLHLARVFGLHPTTAIRYADSARALLERPHESDLSPSPRTHGSDGGKGGT